jgi:alpha-1,3-rhamnosyltransferase
MFAEKMTENVYVKAFAQGEEMEQRELPPLVSVLLASYNHEKYVEAAVRSVMAQKGVAFELIVIDDGSKDKSPEILERLSAELRFRYVHRENKGVVATLNELVSLARGKYFCSFASDDVMPPDRLKIQSDYLVNHPQHKVCFGQIHLMDEQGNVSAEPDPRYLKSIPEITFEEFFLGIKDIHGCSEMIDMAEFRRLGGYNEACFQEDFPMILKLLHEYGRAPVITCNCCYYRIHGNNLSSLNNKDSINKIYEGMIRAIDCYKDHVLYRKARAAFKANWFSALAYNNKVEALKKIPQLASLSVGFIRRIPKLFIPRIFLKH